jgi:hypothetical protein
MVRMAALGMRVTWVWTVVFYGLLAVTVAWAARKTPAEAVH